MGPPARRSPAARGLEFSAQGGGALGQVVGQGEGGAGQRHHVDTHTVGQPGERVLPQVDQRGDDVVLTRRDPVQGRDRVHDRAARGQLVVDQHERAGSGDHARVGRQQQVLRVVRVLLGERARRPEPRHRTAGGVQVVGPAERLGDAVAQRGGRLREPEHHRVGRTHGDPGEQRGGRTGLAADSGVQERDREGPRRAPGQRVGDEAAEQQARRPDQARVGGMCLPSTRETSSWARRGLSRSASPNSTRGSGPSAGPDSRTPSRSTTEPVTTPVIGGCPRRAGRRTRRPRPPPRTPSPAASSAAPTTGAAGSRSSCCRARTP